jgi:hypothetical protein
MKIRERERSWIHGRHASPFNIFGSQSQTRLLAAVHRQVARVGAAAVRGRLGVCAVMVTHVILLRMPSPRGAALRCKAAGAARRNRRHCLRAPEVRRANASVGQDLAARRRRRRAGRGRWRRAGRDRRLRRLACPRDLSALPAIVRELHYRRWVGAVPAEEAAPDVRARRRLDR